MKILPESWVTTYIGPDSQSSIDCWAVPSTVNATVTVGSSQSAQHRPLELMAELAFPDGS